MNEKYDQAKQVSDYKARNIHALLFEDNPGDAYLFREYASECQITNFEITNVDSLADGIRLLSQEIFDIIVLDLDLIDSTGLETFQKAHENAEDIPIVVVTGHDDTGLAIETVHKGAQDFLAKGSLSADIIERTLVYAIERKKLVKLEEEIKAARIETETVKQAQGQFLSNVSHELRTPLTAVTGYLQLLQHKPQQDRGAAELILKALGEAHQLEDRINDVLQMSKVRSGDLTTENSIFDLNMIFGPIVRRNRQRAKANGINFMSTITVSDAICSDQNKLSYIITALIDNAVKFTREGFIRVSIDQSGSDLIFEVKDTGIGIDPSQQEHLFEAFQDSPEYLMQQGQSFGIGLPISKAYLDLLNGTIMVDSSKERGTTFTVKIPDCCQVPENSNVYCSDGSLRQALGQLEVEAIDNLRETILSADPAQFQNLLQLVEMEQIYTDELMGLIDSYQYNQILDLLPDTPHQSVAIK